MKWCVTAVPCSTLQHCLLMSIDEYRALDINSLRRLGLSGKDGVVIKA